MKKNNAMLSLMLQAKLTQSQNICRHFLVEKYPLLNSDQNVSNATFAGYRRQEWRQRADQQGSHLLRLGYLFVLLYRITASSKHKQTKQFPQQQGCKDLTSAHMYTVRKYFVHYRHSAEFIILSYNFKTMSNCFLFSQISSQEVNRTIMEQYSEYRELSYQQNSFYYEHANITQITREKKNLKTSCFHKYLYVYTMFITRLLFLRYS